MQSTIIINDDTVSKEDICYFYSIAFPREQNPFFFPYRGVNVLSWLFSSSAILLEKVRP